MMPISLAARGEFIGEETVEFGQRILWFEQPCFEADLLRVLKARDRDAHVLGMGGRDDLPGGGEHGGIHLVEPLPKKIERGSRADR